MMYSIKAMYKRAWAVLVLCLPHTCYCFNLARVFVSNVEYTLCNDLEGHVYGRYSLVAIADHPGSGLKSVSLDPFRYIPVSVDVTEQLGDDHRIGSNGTFSSAQMVVRTACVEYGGDVNFFANALKSAESFDLEMTYGSVGTSPIIFQETV